MSKTITATLFAALFAAMVWGCSKDDTAHGRPDGIWVRATLPAATVTPTRYSADGQTLTWSADDAFSLYYIPEGLEGSGRSNVKFSLFADAGNRTAGFSPASALDWSRNAARQAFYAVFPYGDGYGSDPRAVSVTLDGQMWLRDNNRPMGEKPLMTASRLYDWPPADDGVEMEFTIRTNTVNFELNLKGTPVVDQPVESVSVALNQPLVGQVTVDLVSGTLSGGNSTVLSYGREQASPDGILTLSAMVLPGVEEKPQAVLTLTTSDNIVIIDAVELEIEPALSGMIVTVDLNVKQLLDSGRAVIIANEVENLSAKGVANAYIVSGPGSYVFDAKIPSEDSSGTAVDGITGASWAWMTGEGADVIAGNTVEYDATNGRIKFSIVNFKPGSVVISAHDADKTILWNWHIWATDLLRGDFDSGAMMPYNIGATSFDRTLKDHTTLGHYYQWGQPYPIIGSGVHDMTGLGHEEYGDEPEPFITLTAPCVINNGYFPHLEWNGVEGYYVPTGEYDDEGNEYYDYVSTEEIVQNDYAAGVTLPTKMYAIPYNLPGENRDVWPVMADPCPAGWRLPTIVEMGGYFGLSGPGTHTRNITLDKEFLGAVPTDHPDDWWPLAGLRWHQSSGLWQVGEWGVYHSADRIFSESGLRLISSAALSFKASDGTVSWPAGTSWSAHSAASVRCIKK